MPRTRPRITTAETTDNRDRLSQLRQRGIAIGETESLPAKPARLVLEQVHHEFAHLGDAQW